MKYLLLIITTLMVVGCGKTDSIIISKKAEHDDINQGVIYSLPMQLVKVTYEKTIVDKVKLQEAYNKLSSQIIVLTGEIKDLDDQIKTITSYIEGINLEHGSGATLHAQKQIQRLDLMTQKLKKSEAVASAKVKRVGLLEQIAAFPGDDSKCMYQETFKVEPQSITPDYNNTFVAQHNHTGRHSEVMQLKVVDGLLNDAVGSSEDKTSEIISTFVGGLAGIPEVKAGAPRAPLIAEDDECDPRKVKKISRTINPQDIDDIAMFNRLLSSSVPILCLSIESEGKASLDMITKADKAKADKAKADKAKADKAKADKAKADKAKADIAKADKAKAGKTKAGKTKADKAKAGKTKADKAVKCNTPRETFPVVLSPTDDDSDKNYIKTKYKDDVETIVALNGLVYRTPGPFKFKLTSIAGNDYPHLDSVTVNLPQGGYFGVVPLPKGRLAKTEYEVEFKNGVLTRSKFTRPSEVLGFIKIIPNMLKAIIEIPTELIQLKVDYSTGDSALVDLQKAMLEAEVAIYKKQQELDGLINPPSVPEDTPEPIVPVGPGGT